MIEVTRLNGNRMVVNSDLIKIAEAAPDTMLTLLHGDKLIVKESCEEILDKILAYRARLLASIAAQSSNPQDLLRSVALTSHNPDANKFVAARSGPTLLRTDSNRNQSEYDKAEPPH